MGGVDAGVVAGSVAGVGGANGVLVVVQPAKRAAARAVKNIWGFMVLGLFSV